MKYRLVCVRHDAVDTKIFGFEPVLPPVFKFRPGQFAFIHLLDETGKSVIKRPYSIASSPFTNHLEFCIKMIGGALTAPLDKLTSGAVVGIEGPLGHFTFEDSAKNVCLMAGGSGIAPLMSMVRSACETNSDAKIVLFHTVRDITGALYTKELEDLQKKSKNLTVVVTLTREIPQGWSGESGRFSTDMFKKYLTDCQTLHCWVCGPMELIKSSKDMLVSIGVDPKKIKLEGWG